MKTKVCSILLLIALAMILSGLLYYSHGQEPHVIINGGSIGEKYYGMNEGKEKIMTFDLVDPESAPEDVVNDVLLGYRIMLDTKANASKYVGNSLSCTHCHFCGGNTLGGKNRGISLVGVTAMYPKYSKRDKKNITLVERLDNCFKRSMNGSIPPADSVEMHALVAYLEWISSEVNNAPSLPWLGLDPIISKYVPNKNNGILQYQLHCATCHGENGEGSKENPPLWGNHSFNDGAGMNLLPMLASFIHLNMPYGQPVLTPEEAMDVAAFIISKPRPHFSP